MFPIVLLLYISLQNLSLRSRVTQKDLQLPVFFSFPPSLPCFRTERQKFFSMVSQLLHK